MLWQGCHVDINNSLEVSLLAATYNVVAYLPQSGLQAGMVIMKHII
jgi:hypothetical protein